MTEARRFADLKYGHAGILTYTPKSVEELKARQVGSLHSSHIKTERPHFKQLGSTGQVYAASCSKPPQLTHARLSAERQLQKRWLQKSHPEALDGISSLPELLTEEIQRFRKVEEISSPQSIIAVGEMMDLTTPSKPKALPVLATATGEAGELLRLTRMEASDWSWDGRQECTLHLPAIDHEIEVDDVVWQSDALPITKIKFAQSTTATGTIRWLAVQKQTATMMFRPQFTQVPMAKNVTYQGSGGPMLSRIDPKHVLTLNHRQTGGNAHVDMAFNPPVDDRPPQLCVIDECGYWTVWNLSGGRVGRKVGLTLVRGGHIWEGPLATIPTTPLFPAEVHGVLFVGTEHDTVLGMSQGRSSISRSKLVLLWSGEYLKLVDTEVNVMLPEVEGLVTAKSHHDRIVGVQISPFDQSHVYVLTVRYLIWIELVTSTSETGPAVKPKIRLTCPHLLPGGAHLKMTVTSQASSQGDVALVHVYSSSHDQINAFWFQLQPDGELPQWDSHLMTIRTEEDNDKPRPSTFCNLVFLPLSIDILPKAKGPGLQYLQQGICFFQGWLIGHDLSVHYCMCIASTKPELDVNLPHKRLNWTSRDKIRKAKHRRKVMLRFLGNAAVVPDAMTDEAILSLRRQHGDEVDEEESEIEDNKIVKTGRPIHLNLNRLVRSLKEQLDAPPAEGNGIPIALLEAVQGAVHHGLAAGRLPLTTWKELARGLEPNENDEMVPPEDLEEAIQGFLSGAGDEAVIAKLSRRGEKEPERSVGSLLRLQNQFSAIWVDPLRDRLSEEAVEKRMGWVNELARDLFLSTHGVAVQDTPLFGHEAFIKAEDGQSQSSLPRQPSLPHIQSSQPSSSIPSSPVSTTPDPTTTTPNEALRRLSLLAPSIQPATTSSRGMTKPAPVLDFWPAQRGVDVEGYVSSVAIASDQRFDDARQRLQKMQDKKKAVANRLRSTRLGSSKRSFQDTEGLPTQPPIQSSQGPPIIKSETQVPMSSQGPAPIMSSQGGSSQSHNRVGTMSQVVPGAFGGDRRKAKKVKKKSGFR